MFVGLDRFCSMKINLFRKLGELEITMKNGIVISLTVIFLVLGLAGINFIALPPWLVLVIMAIGLILLWLVVAQIICSIETVLQRHHLLTPYFWQWGQTIESLDDKIVEKMRSVERVPLQLAETVRKQEYVDKQTNLGNRRFFDARLDVFLIPEQRTGEGVLILIELTGIDELELEGGLELDSDRLKVKKDSLIEQAAILLQNALNDFPHAVLSRRGRTEFSLFIHPITKNQSSKIAEKLDQALRLLPLPPSYLADNFFHIGLVRIDTDISRHDLLAKADLALRNAQLRGSCGWFELSEEQETTARGMVQWRTLFERAVNQHKIRLLVQPVQYFQSGEIVHSEIFARLVDDNGQEISAEEFIPMAMASGFLERLDRLVVDQVIKWMMYQDQVKHSVTVNLSTESLLTPKFLDWLIQRLYTKPSLIEHFIVEFAERPLFGQESLLIDAILKLKNLGITVGIDHVGEQLVTLDYLEDFPIDYAKIHRSVISKIGSEQHQHEEVLIGSLSQVAQAQGFTLFAEGIESSLQLEALKNLGVVGGQGYLLGTPTSLENLNKSEVV